MNNLKIRKGQLNDLLELQKLFVDTVSNICKTDYNDEQINIWISGVENLERWKEMLTDQFVLIAQDKQEITGFCTLKNNNYLDFLYIHKDYQRQGIATKLYYEIEQVAQKAGETTITSEVSKTAKNFFEKIGFKVLKEQNINIKGVEITNYKMIKNLF